MRVRKRTARLFAFIVAFTIGTGANATEDGGSQRPLGVATILQGVAPTPPGFNFINDDVFYNSDRVNNAEPRLFRISMSMCDGIGA